MHIPDGFLNAATLATTGAVSAGGIGVAVRQVNRKLKEKQVPLMGVLAAFIFAAQMLNFPVVGGTSGHVIGAALAAILLGPWAAILIMACVLIAQSLIFQDGGLLALGANVFNMGLVAVFTAYLTYRTITAVFGESRRVRLVSGFAAAWVSVELASIAASLELAFSGASPLHIVLPAMAGVHALIGIGEGLVTAAALALVLVARADLWQVRKARRSEA
jgi:cobalt/nickel transport system permease protein